MYADIDVRRQYFRTQSRPLTNSSIVPCSLASPVAVAFSSQFVKLRNPWGQGNWEGDWGEGSNKWDDYPEVFAELSAGEDDDRSSFWMTFGDVANVFGKIYVCRTFSDEQGWSQYCCTGDWVGKTAGGGPASSMVGGLTSMMNKSSLGILGEDKDKPETIEKSGGTVESLADGLKSQTKVLDESDPFWFNNPQFQFRVEAKTRLHLSLTQQDRRIRSQLRDNYPIAFEIVKTKR